MSVSASKENILKKIRQALSHSTPIPFPKSEGQETVFEKAAQEPAIEFAEQFSRLKGRFIYCATKEELADQLTKLVEVMNWEKIFCLEDTLIPAAAHFKNNVSKENLATCDVAITGCESLVARTGSIVLSSAQLGGRTTSVYTPVHICIALTSQLVYDIKDALQLVKNKYGHHLPSLITFATGPSRTADIEKTLVVGVHGPKEVYVLLVEA